MTFLAVQLVWLLCLSLFGPFRANNEANDAAVVSLLMGEQYGYVQGAMALGKSLIDVKSVLPRVLMVTPEVTRDSFQP